MFPSNLIIYLNRYFLFFNFQNHRERCVVKGLILNLNLILNNISFRQVETTLIQVK